MFRVLSILIAVLLLSACDVEEAAEPTVAPPTTPYVLPTVGNPYAWDTPVPTPTWTPPFPASELTEPTEFSIDENAGFSMCEDLASLFQTRDDVSDAKATEFIAVQDNRGVLELFCAGQITTTVYSGQVMMTAWEEDGVIFFDCAASGYQCGTYFVIE